MTNRERLLTILAEIMQKEPDQIDLSASIESLGINSLDVVEMLMDVEMEFDVYLAADADLTEARNVGELLDALEQKIEAQKNG
jgi:acyl carrier protein